MARGRFAGSPPVIERRNGLIGFEEREMKIQIVKKGTARGADVICPWLVDVPTTESKKS